jgi:hypothetical protein
MKYFMACIETHQATTPGWQEGLVNMRVVDAAMESSQTGKLEACGAKISWTRRQ